MQGEGDAFRCLTCTEPADFHAVRDIGENRADWPGIVAVAVMFFFHDVMATSWKKDIPFGMHRKKKICLSGGKNSLRHLCPPPQGGIMETN